MPKWVETFALWIGLGFLLLLFISGLWVECTVTDPEYFFSR